MTKGRSSWKDFLIQMTARGLHDVEFIVADDHAYACDCNIYVRSHRAGAVCRRPFARWFRRRPASDAMFAF
jgi:transposase-like protein